MAFKVAVPDAVLADLSERIARTRWPTPVPGIGWEQGIDYGFLQGLLGYWADGFDWRAQEARLNAYPQDIVSLDGVEVHFVHVKAVGGRGIPLILTHGWPSCFIEYLPLVPLLTDPGAHGIDGPAFDLVIPSLPGYGFSPRPPVVGVNYRYVAALWHRLMGNLGYERYGAGGGDFGAGVATLLGKDFPESVIGLHLTTMEMRPSALDNLSAEETEYVAATRAWDSMERGYSSIQSTKPQTLGIGLNDSPAGLAAWILEKWRSWSDCGGDVEARFGRDFLLTLVTIYWVTGTIATSIRDYYDNRWHAVDPGRVEVPAGFGVFANEFVSEGTPPREWMERLYSVRRWTVMPRGGHFAAAEEPRLLAQDIATFFEGL